MFVNSGHLKFFLQFCRIVIAQNPRYQHVAVFLSLLLQSAYDEVTLNNLEVSFVTHTKGLHCMLDSSRICSSLRVSTSE